MKLEGHVAIVTGGGGSIGRAVGSRFAAEGAAVVVADIDAEQTGKVEQELKASGAEAMTVAVDVRDRRTIEHMVDSVLERFGQIDILVNNAGGSARERNAFFHELPDEVLDWVLGVNLLGPLFCIRSVINHMMERRQGKIVNIASIVGIHGKQKLADYSAAKGGMIAFTKSLAMEVGPYNINVNCVSPGLVPRSPKEYEGAASRSYLGRHCTPENIADLVTFLSSEEASYITGQNYVIDGGRSLGLKGD